PEVDDAHRLDALDSYPVGLTNARGLDVQLGLYGVEPVLPVASVSFELPLLVLEVQTTLQGIGFSGSLDDALALRFDDGAHLAGFAAAALLKTFARPAGGRLRALSEVREQLGDVPIDRREKPLLHGVGNGSSVARNEGGVEHLHRSLGR